MKKKLKLNKKTIAKLNDTKQIIGGADANHTLLIVVCNTQVNCGTNDKKCLSIFDCGETFGLCQTQDPFCRTAM